MTPDWTETRTQTGTAATAFALTGPLHPGAQLGNYRIQRLLGEGGMGRVYQAEQLDSGRLVALKLLHQTAPTPSERERFLREGRLAASVSHPNSVFVFGTEEIGSTQVIVMELIGGGTLKDKLAASGPLPIDDAIRTTIQLLNGLEAAHATGILHRDIKPSNCFLEPDGSVKLGDFGISRPASGSAASGSTTFTLGGFAGTPAYASPEQLDGAKVDERSDIYSLGATLYHLLTGRPPFEQRELVQLIAAVVSKPPRDPRELRPEIPKPLASAVLRCLAKNPADRFASAAEVRLALRECLQPPKEATATQRFSAFLIDWLSVGLVVLLLGFLLDVRIEGYAFPSPAGPLGIPMLEYFIPIIGAIFGAIEGRYGAVFGMRVFDLRVVNSSGGFIGIALGILRAIIFQIPYLVSRAYSSGNPSDSAQGALLTGITLLTALSVCFAHVHDRLTGARVIRRLSELVIKSDSPALPQKEQSAASGSRGPYRLMSKLLEFAGTTTWQAWDPVLSRSVWIVDVPSGTPPLFATDQATSRPARARWLGGQRKDTLCWDAFHLPPGQPLLAVAGPVAWRHVNHWMLDIAEEVALDPSLNGELALNRVWISTRGRAVLTNFPLVATSDPLTQRLALPALLQQIAAATRTGPTTEAPLAALESLPNLAEGEKSSEKIWNSLRSIHESQNLSFQKRRLLQLLPACLLLGGLHFAGSARSDKPEIDRVRWLVSFIERNRQAHPAEVQILMQYTARYGESVGRLSRELPSPLLEEIRAIPETTRVKRWQEIKINEMVSEATRAPRFGGAVVVGVIAFFSLFAAFFRNHLTWSMSGLALVIPQGRKASRWRYLARTTLVLLPGVPIATRGIYPTPSALYWIAITIYVASAIWAVATPNRAPVDHLTGTYIVPE